MKITEILKFMILSITYIHLCSSFRIGSFNLQVFGQSKVSNPEVVDTIVKILSRYDLVVIQEIRSKNDRPIKYLMKKLNDYSDGKYNYFVGSRLGRSHSKEQYGVIYKNYLVEIENMNEHLDKFSNFERPPLEMIVHIRKSKIPSFRLFVVHLDPDTVSAELNAMYEIVRKSSPTSHSDNVIVIGDMNADCRFLSKSKRLRVKFREDKSYKWLISDNIDTTVGKSNCAYDRIIVRGEKLMEAIKIGSAKTFQFPDEFKLQSHLAKKVSDHYPVEVELKV